VSPNKSLEAEEGDGWDLRFHMLLTMSSFIYGIRTSR